LIPAPIQKNHTARIGTVPVIKPFVNEPKYSPDIEPPLTFDLNFF
jgi:hypothetical protein